MGVLVQIRYDSEWRAVKEIIVLLLKNKVLCDDVGSGLGRVVEHVQPEPGTRATYGGLGGLWRESGSGAMP